MPTDALLALCPCAAGGKGEPLMTAQGDAVNGEKVATPKVPDLLTQLGRLRSIDVPTRGAIRPSSSVLGRTCNAANGLTTSPTLEYGAAC